MMINLNKYGTLEIGDVVNYHSVIGGLVTSTGHILRAFKSTPNNFGVDVAWITGKSGCVAVDALSRADNTDPV